MSELRGSLMADEPEDGMSGMMAGADEGGFGSGSFMDEADGDLDGSIREDKDPFLSTLDEPVSATIMRDVRSIMQKFYHVLLPHKSKGMLHDWDLWGPLTLTLTLAFMLRSSAKHGQQTSVFSGVFVLVWVGSAVVTVNAKLLGCNLSFFQCICVLGYCMVPLVVALIVMRLVAYFVTHLAFRFLVVTIAWAWALFASTKFLGDIDASRRMLVLYPISLFYLSLSWLVLND